MTKITIISGIIAAVCILQTVEAGILDKFPNLDSLKSPLENKWNDVLGNVVQKSQEELLNSKECNDAWDEGIKVSTQIQSNFRSCFLNVNNLKPEVDKLTNAVNNLIMTGTKLFESMTNFDISGFKDNISNMRLLLSKAVDAADKCKEVFPEVGTCIQNAIPPSKNWEKIAKLGKQCLGNVFPFQL